MTVPLRTDEHGTICVSGTRVTLDRVIARFQQGASPEQIQESFDVLPVNDIYAVIAYYLAHHDELDVFPTPGSIQQPLTRHEVILIEHEMFQDGNSFRGKRHFPLI
jgi:uncharacterized protein (DUF433 family)